MEISIGILHSFGMPDDRQAAAQRLLVLVGLVAGLDTPDIFLEF